MAEISYFVIFCGFEKVPIKSQLKKALCHKFLALCHKLYEISAKSTIKSQLENTLFLIGIFQLKLFRIYVRKPRQNLDKTSTKPRQNLDKKIKKNKIFLKKVEKKYF